MLLAPKFGKNITKIRLPVLPEKTLTRTIFLFIKWFKKRTTLDKTHTTPV